MKKLSLYIVLACLTVLPLAAQTTAPMLHADSFYFWAEVTGKLHNEGLDTAMVMLNREKKDLLELHEVRYFRELPQEIRAEFPKKIQEYSMKAFEKLKKRYPELLSLDKITPVQSIMEQGNIGNGGVTEEKKYALREKLTPFQQKYFDILTNNTEQEGSLTPEQIISKMMEIEKEIKAEAPSPEEVYPVVLMAVMGRYSMQYWQANLTKWMRVLNAPIDEERSPGLYPVSGEPSKYLMITPQYEYKTCDCPEGTIFDEKTRNCLPKERMEKLPDK
ncbi:MAG: carbohydrate-binding module family 14 protein [Proteiniphilum sp.]|nr:carbohydrate-binding module family 14 protein [Proteiniphilum sp.]